MATLITPLQLFFYGLAVAGSLAAIGAVVILLIVTFLVVVAPPVEQDEKKEEEAAAAPMQTKRTGRAGA